MNTMKTLTLSLIACALAGCAISGPGKTTGHGLLAETRSARLPAGLATAVIYEIDGERVVYGRGTHRVSPGVHTVRVWPDAAGPRSGSPIPGAHADALGITVEPLVIEVQEGARYQLAAAVRRHRVYARDGGGSTPLGPWRTTIVPVVVKMTGT